MENRLHLSKNVYRKEDGVSLTQRKEDSYSGVYLEDNRLDTQQNPIQKKPNNTGLPDNLKSGIENMSGYSMDDVKVHYNSNKPTQLNAHAYAQGTDIHVASGQEQHVPHEAWHVVQQKQGRVQPTTSVNGAQVNDNVGLEIEADVMGAKALQMKTKVSEPLEEPMQLKSNDTVQRNSIEEAIQYGAVGATIGARLGLFGALAGGLLGGGYGYFFGERNDNIADTPELEEFSTDESEGSETETIEDLQEMSEGSNTEELENLKEIIKEEEEQKDDKLPLDEEKEVPKEPTYSGKVNFTTSGRPYVMHKGEQIYIKMDNAPFFNNGTTVSYQLEEHPLLKGLYSAKVTSVGELQPESTWQQDNKEALSKRTDEVKELNLNKPINLIGQFGPEPTGARKHYDDDDAIATSDKDLRDLIANKLNSKAFEIQKIEDKSDEFKIPLGGLMSIVGSIEYTNESKQNIQRIKVWHAGPSM
ncbi:eCIS core domain-containing protein [Tenacibaculum agarivorans]|uniref:eCIS core domain-containing protein n=1 Tax=Tenacibaculum agarivorans TaxID=1908389 RepID=UPI0009F9FE46|nr:DUF4157 domain-containing protein [Tenacibaculum agarivorans]